MATTALAVPQPHRAEKKRVKLKMAVQGPSGSGKTWGALSLAKNLWPNGKVCLIDTENESASLYADKFEFDTIPLSPPFETSHYLACINAAVSGGYDVLIIDSITAQWDGEGGILRRKEDLERRSPGVNGYTLWAKFTPEHEAFKQAILQSPIHIIATMRSKQEYALQTNDKGKQVPVKMGLAPIQRDQIDYEFTLVFDVGMSHIGVVSKDRTALFNDKTVDLADPKTAEAIRGWLESGKQATPETAVTPASVVPFPAIPEPRPILDGEPDIRPKSQRGNPTSAGAQSAGKSNPSSDAGVNSNTAPQGEVVGAEPSITVPQGKRFFAIAKSAGLSDEQVKQRLASIGLHCHRDSIPKSRYNAAIDVIDPDFKFHQRS